MIRQTSRALATVLLPIALALAGCRDSSVHGAPFDSVSIGNGGKTTIVTAGVTIEVDGAVPFRSVSTTTTGSVPESKSTVWGYGFGVVDGMFRIGAENYGAVTAGDRVRVAADGVFVNDARRGNAP